MQSPRVVRIPLEMFLDHANRVPGLSDCLFIRPAPRRIWILRQRDW